jgi:hypothetical protein
MCIRFYKKYSCGHCITSEKDEHWCEASKTGDCPCLISGPQEYMLKFDASCENCDPEQKS